MWVVGRLVAVIAAAGIVAAVGPVGSARAYSDQCSTVTLEPSVSPMGLFALAADCGSPGDSDYFASATLWIYPLQPGVPVTGRAVRGAADYIFGSADGPEFVPVTMAGTYRLTVVSGGASGDIEQVAEATVEGPPVLTTPGLALRAGTTMTSTLYPARLSWSQRAGSTASAFEVQRSIDGGAWSTIATTGSTSINTGVAGRLYEFRVRGYASEMGWGEWSSVTTRPAAYSERSARFTYSGTWRRASKSSFWGGRARYASARGRTVTLRFTGRSVAIVGTTGPNRGSYSLTLDGVRKGSFSTYATSTRYRRLILSVTWPKSGVHVLTMRVLGTPGHPRIDLDGALVIP